MEPDYAVTIRRATPQHIPDLVRLAGQFPTVPRWSELQYRRLFQEEEGPGPRLVLIADCELPEHQPKEERTVVGFLVAHHIANEWELENIVVAEESRGKGIGTRLVEALFARAKQGNGESVFLEVRESNTVARKLYEKLGFNGTGRRKSYYTNPPEDAILYARKLRSDEFSS